MSRKVLLAHLLLFFVSRMTASNECRSVESIVDYALFSHIHERISEIRMESCASRCDADPYCYSFNFFIPSKTCELNNATSLTDSKNFQVMPGAVYFKKLKPPHDFCEAFPCQNNGTCKILDRAPVFECSCPTEYSGETCEVCNPSSLGLSNHELSDLNFNASSSFSPFAPRDARLYANTSWANEGYSSDEFLQISFHPYSKLITGVATQGNPHHDWWIYRYYLHYSLDGFTWSFYEVASYPGSRKEFVGNTDRNTVVTNQLQRPIRAMYLRIVPRAWQNKVALRVEVYGCS